ncbi:hotdog fold thioesterase [Salinibius halmophilus]|uniref:hotdog fold thioesterase n=1 Tax=Salinibius halmophilus TaxID=1853216 RepID=UPI000E661DC1|nr:hotdog fold thioesterase [Salinibius halmophilus]
MDKFVQLMTTDAINQMSDGTLVSTLGIKITEVGENTLTATMPVDARTKQPFGLLHGGANVVLAETLASIGAQMMLPRDKMAVGLEINANHLRSVRQGMVTGKAFPIKVGQTVQVWQIDIFDDQGRQTCTCRMTASVVNNPSR